MAEKNIKIGTQVRMNPKASHAKFWTGVGVGIVSGKFGKGSYEVDFGNGRVIVMEPKDIIVVKNPIRGYKHPNAVTMAKVEAFTEGLHVSGIDYEWKITETKTSFRASNGFHSMDEWGGYDGTTDFTVIFPKNVSMNDFSLQFNGDQYLAQKHMLREYLEDTIVYTLDRLKLR